MKKKAFWAIPALLILIGLLAGFDARREAKISGRTMGTTYHIKVVAGLRADIDALETAIAARLEDINKSMSTYMKTSEISRFNAVEKTDEPFYVSDDFLQVMAVARDIYRLTGGAWDGTVNPLVRLWGFGGPGTYRKPAQAEIDRNLETVGFNFIDISSDSYLRKKKPGVTLDLASIAKGYGVDQIAELIEKNGMEDFIVEIGGEVYASGRKKDGSPWRVGINTPSADASLSDIHKVVNLSDRAFATSGDYRNFFEMDGRRYAHILDPRTGYPVSNNVVSATVIADACTFADGLATALIVMGPENGVELVNSLDGVECLIIVRQPDGGLKDYASAGFAAEGQAP